MHRLDSERQQSRNAGALPTDRPEIDLKRIAFLVTAVIKLSLHQDLEVERGTDSESDSDSELPDALLAFNTAKN